MVPILRVEASAHALGSSWRILAQSYSGRKCLEFIEGSLESYFGPHAPPGGIRLRFEAAPQSLLDYLGGSRLNFRAGTPLRPLCTSPRGHNQGASRCAWCGLEERMVGGEVTYVPDGVRYCDVPGSQDLERIWWVRFKQVG